MKSGSNKTQRTSKAKVERSSGNVFADLDLPNAAECLARAELAQEICNIIVQRKLTQVRAAATLGVDQPKVSALMRGKIDGFSTDRLIRLLNALGRDVQIVIRPMSRANRPAGVRVRSVSRAS